MPRSPRHTLDRVAPRAVALLVAVLCSSSCKAREATDPVDDRAPASAPASRPVATSQPATSSADPPALGPPRAEEKARVTAARAEAARLTKALRDGGVAPREVSSVADIRGYRLMRQRRYRQALAWFEAAIAIDGTFEPAHFNAGRAAARLGRRAHARRHLARLGTLGTPLARRQLARAAEDPLLRGLLGR